MPPGLAVKTPDGQLGTVLLTDNIKNLVGVIFGPVGTGLAHDEDETPTWFDPHELTPIRFGSDDAKAYAQQMLADTPLADKPVDLDTP
jgi:hypothetical protein